MSKGNEFYNFAIILTQRYWWPY